jgi:hypothetical protein
MATKEPRKTAIELGEDGAATIVAALRLFQRTYKYRAVEDISADFPEIFTAEHFQFGAVLDPTPLDTHDIDDLCEQLGRSNVLNVAE